MKLKRNLTDKEWAEIAALGPGFQTFQGKKTLFWNEVSLYDVNTGEYFDYDKEERESWEVIIVLPGVEVIPTYVFRHCINLEKVIMADTVQRIEKEAFFCCMSLEFVKLSRSLEYVGESAFDGCQALTSIFIPPSCTEICNEAFWGCRKLIILSIPRTTEIGDNVIASTKLIKSSHFDEDELQTDVIGNYENNEQVNAWIKNMNGDDDEYALHRACSSFNPITDIVYGIVKRKEIVSFWKKNEIGINPLKYLEENPFADVHQHTLMKRYILEMMGEIV